MRPRPKTVAARSRLLTRCVAVGLAGALVLLWPTAAGAATVSVRPSTTQPFLFPAHEVVFAAAPGERNRVVVVPAFVGTPWTVSDGGAVLVAGEGCLTVDEHTVRCVAPPSYNPMEGLQLADVRLGDLDDRVELVQNQEPWKLVADGGSGRDELVGAAGGGELRGGPGDDVLLSRSRFASLAILDGGGGRDELRGGAGSDVLSDGDLDGAVGDGRPGPDVLDGGDGTDMVSYGPRTLPVSVDLGDRGADGAPGEGDRILGVESVVGGAGDDLLVGDEGRNEIDGGNGRDTLVGREGDDQFANGRGPILCGAGDDRVLFPKSTDFLKPGCEHIADDAAGGPDHLAYPAAIGARSVRYRVRCPYDPDLDSFHRCSGTVTLTEAGGQRRRLGRGTFPRGPWARRAVRVGLTRRGRTLVSRPAGVTTVVTLAERLGPGRSGSRETLRWSIRLRRPR